MKLNLKNLLCGLVAVASMVQFAQSQSFVAHAPGSQAFNQPSGVTQRDPATPREEETVTVYFRVGYQFQYSSVAMYYTTDGTVPAGNIGFGSGTTVALANFRNQVQFVANENPPQGVVDWWRVTLPVNTRDYGKRIRYFFQAWGATTQASSGQFEFTNKIAWPGRGSGNPNPNVGYPPFHMWKEEAVTGNNYINIMLDQNGSIYDVYYPGAGTVQGVAAKNEGYVDGLDTFPPGLPLDSRGQLNMNAAFAGIRVDGTTYWMSNKAGTDFSGVQQEYLGDSQTVKTSQRLVAGGNNIKIEQYAFTPKNIAYPTDLGGSPNRGLGVIRYVLKNEGSQSKTFNFYYYGDFALNGGDNFDGMFHDAGRGAMIAYDNVFRMTSTSGEYNPSSFGNYEKNVSLYMGIAMKTLNTVGGTGGTPATDTWRDTSTDNNEGWIGSKMTLAPGESKEVNILVVGGFDRPAGMTGTYNFQMVPAVDWFLNGNMASAQTTTDTYWDQWVDLGVTVDTPDDGMDNLFNRGKLGTALHLDGKSGGVVAGMHNGAYMYCWPRDAVWAAVTLDRSGHNDEASEVYRFLRTVAYRGDEPWGKGFFYQKYTLDGYTIWSAPQVDETAVVPWGVKYHYDCVGDNSILTTNYTMVKDSAYAMSSDSTLDSRMYYNDPVKLVYSMNLWEDRFDVFNYSNANVVRGLWDAAWIANRVGDNGNAGVFNGRAADILQGLKDRLDWNGENCDISQLGIVYPFEVMSPVDNRAKKVIDRINGVATDRFGNNQPLVNFSGEWQDLINRYWGDTYWNGGPWTLSTLWYGVYYAMRADYTPGKGDIDNHLFRLNKVRQFLGPVGLGAEQIAPSNSLLYPGQPDFRHQAAWPNAWESMSFLVDSIMQFVDFTPDASANTLRIAPKLPTAWNTMTFKNLRYGPNRVDAKLTEGNQEIELQLTNRTGLATNFDTYLKIAPGQGVGKVFVNGRSIRNFTYDAAAHRVRVQGALSTGANSVTTVRVQTLKTGSTSGTRTPIGGGRR